ncbi:ferritin-like domain-containing protein, partial [Archangium sp.]|uniref:ferritin-like domain-containing protein n=1 Tax=Archangium sp. TaxID=1872627 RepID=UPI002ED79AEE
KIAGKHSFVALRRSLEMALKRNRLPTTLAVALLASLSSRANQLDDWCAPPLREMTIGSGGESVTVTLGMKDLQRICSGEKGFSQWYRGLSEAQRKVLWPELAMKWAGLLHNRIEWPEISHMLSAFGVSDLERREFTQRLEQLNHPKNKAAGSFSFVSSNNEKTAIELVSMAPPDYAITREVLLRKKENSGVTNARSVLFEDATFGVLSSILKPAELRALESWVKTVDLEGLRGDIVVANAVPVGSAFSLIQLQAHRSNKSEWAFRAGGGRWQLLDRSKSPADVLKELLSPVRGVGDRLRIVEIALTQLYGIQVPPPGKTPPKYPLARRTECAAMTNDKTIIQMPENAVLNERMLPTLVTGSSIRFDTDWPLLHKSKEGFQGLKYELWRIRIDARSPLTVTEENVASGAERPIPVGCGRLYADWTGPAHKRHPTTASAMLASQEGPASPGEAARFWLNACRLEWASVASFNRTSMELMALGAPLSLIHRVQKAALEEARHVQHCAWLARHFGASEEEITTATTALAALAPRTLSRAEYGMLVIHEAVAQEALGASLLGDMAEHCQDEAVASRLRRIARDELRHARLACDMVRWLVGEEGLPAFVPEALALLDSLARQHPVYLARVARGALPTRSVLRRAHQTSRALLQAWLAPPLRRKRRDVH